jgi:hypothetical protein
MTSSLPGANGNSSVPTNRLLATSASNGNHALERTPIVKRVPPRLYLLGLVALAGWMMLFAMGLLIETVEYRFLLSPRSVTLQLGREGVKTLPKEMRDYAESMLSPTPTVPAPARPPLTAAGFLKAFGISVLCFTPLNLAILTLFAGLAGGCASNIMIISLPIKNLKQLRKENPHRYFFLQEPPVSAAIRGFVVFMCIIAGLYIAIEDPFKDPTPAQYIRMVGLLSIMAFMVGYDPSRLDDWLRLVPTPGKTTTDANIDDKQKRQVSKVEVEQVTKEETITKTTASLTSPAEKPGLPETQDEAAKKEAAAETAAG